LGTIVFEWISENVRKVCGEMAGKISTG